MPAAAATSPLHAVGDNDGFSAMMADVLLVDQKQQLGLDTKMGIQTADIMDTSIHSTVCFLLERLVIVFLLVCSKSFFTNRLTF